MDSNPTPPNTSDDPPQKRTKLSPHLPGMQETDKALADATESIEQTKEATMPDQPTQPKENEAVLEVEVGITEYISAKETNFSGLFKKRYTDFLVNEILPSGEVLHLTDLGHLPKAPPSTGQREPESDAALEAVVSATNAAPKEAKEVDDAVQPQHASTETTNVIPVRATAVDDADPPQDSPTKEQDAAPTFELSNADGVELSNLVGPDALQLIMQLHQKMEQSPRAKPKSLGSVALPATTDREQRRHIHQAIRRMFSSRLETTTDDDGIISVSVAPRRPPRDAQPESRPRDGPRPSQPRPRGQLGWQELGGGHLHFTLYKENKDTMEVISFLARQLRLTPKSFEFAGTKDRRGVTVQRASVYRVLAERLAPANRMLRGSKIGGFAYEPAGLKLGDLAGNEFVITLRDCHFPGLQHAADVGEASTRMAAALQAFNRQGFINYYGLQRFGAFSARTDVIGMKMLQGDFEGACLDILSYHESALAAAQGKAAAGSMISSDDVARALALHQFQSSGRSHEALQRLPRKFSAEAALIRHLGGRNRAKDFRGALQTIPRNLRLMYVHAYQSLVWNHCAGERWKRFGATVVAGDLVLVGREDVKSTSMEADGADRGAVDDVDEVDESGEIVIRPAAHDAARSRDDMFPRARRLSADEAQSGAYTIFDIVLPTPGFDVLYPGGSLESFYAEFMGSARGGGLDPGDMRRAWRDVSLSGSYRPLVARPLGDDGARFEMREYADENEPLMQTDLERLEQARRVEAGRGVHDEHAATEEGEERKKETTKMAVVLRMQLGSSQYATMALRELMGPGGVRTYRPDYGGGR
ncbi:MAG: hypothetical protein M1826_007741 [Phylliscum demangeonii]|nr:MAG: hypothetical protein M1826_007741 [Phylliscum demangeonii]